MADKQIDAATSEELAKIEARMAEIKETTLEELIRDWPSPWRNEAMTNAKVTGRLGGNRSTRPCWPRPVALRGLRKLGSRNPDEYEQSEDPMGSYADSAGHHGRKRPRCPTNPGIKKALAVKARAFCLVPGFSTCSVRDPLLRSERFALA